MMRMVLHGLVGLAAVGMLSACPSGGTENTKPPEQKPTMAEVQKLETEGAWAKLSAICSQPENQTEGHKYACAAVVKNLGKLGNIDALMEICNGKKGALWESAQGAACGAAVAAFNGNFMPMTKQCQKVEDVFAKYWANNQFNNAERFSSAQRTTIFQRLGEKIVSCGIWDLFWKHLAIQGGFKTESLGEALFAKLGTSKPLDQELVKWLEANKDAPFDYEGGDYAAARAFRWLVNNNKVGDCARFVPYAKKVKDQHMLNAWGPFFHAAKCKAAAGVVAAQLKSNKPAVRAKACLWLETVGSKKNMKAMKKLSQKDPDDSVKAQCNKSFRKVR